MAAVAGILTACDSAAPTQASDLPVIEGWIDSDGYPVVLFTRSLAPADGGEIADAMIRWGKVTISDGESTVVLTGGPSNKYFPPYRYHTDAIVGQPGRTYTITADYDDYHAQARSTMPEPTPIADISVSPLAGSDTLRSLALHFYAPADCPAYYYVNVRDADSGLRAYPAALSAMEVTQPQARVTIPLYMPKVGVDTISYQPNFRVGRKYVVELCRVGCVEYNFWRTYSDLVMFSGTSLIKSSVDISGNIAGGYGIWCARGVSRALVEVN